MSFLSFYLLPPFIERLESATSSEEEPKYQDLKIRVAEEEKRLQKIRMILSLVASSLISWEQGEISAEAALASLKRELMKLQGLG